MPIERSFATNLTRLLLLSPLLLGLGIAFKGILEAQERFASRGLCTGSLQRRDHIWGSRAYRTIWHLWASRWSHHRGSTSTRGFSSLGLFAVESGWSGYRAYRIPGVSTGRAAHGSKGYRPGGIPGEFHRDDQLRVAPIS